MQASTNFEEKLENYNEFIEREFEEVDGGYYDGKGFYITPEGSFWDENLVYFNHEGRDKHGGYYDEYCVYNPGPNWNDEYCCYNDEIILKEVNAEDSKEDRFNPVEEALLEDYIKSYDKYFEKDDSDYDEDASDKDEVDIVHEYLKKQMGLNFDENANLTDLMAICNINQDNTHSNNILNDENLNSINRTNKKDQIIRINHTSGEKMISTVFLNRSPFNSGLKFN